MAACQLIGARFSTSFARSAIADLRSDRPLTDMRFKAILEDYLDALSPRLGHPTRRSRRAQGTAHGCRTSAVHLDVRNYLAVPQPDGRLGELVHSYPTKGARNRYSAVLICEKEGFDELLQHEQIDKRYDLALMSTKGISAFAARDLARELGIPCFTMHDFDKNGFVMAAGFQAATDLGIHLDDIDGWDLEPEPQEHENP